MIKSGDFGYCRYLQNYYGLDSYITMNEDIALEQYLENAVKSDLIMPNSTDRRELIEKINLRVGGHQKNSIISLNKELEHRGLPYQIEKFALPSTMINGERKRCNNAWRVIRQNDSSEL